MNCEGEHGKFVFIYVPNKDVICMGPSMGINGSRDTGSRMVTLEIRPKPPKQLCYVEVVDHILLYSLQYLLLLGSQTLPTL